MSETSEAITLYPIPRTYADAEMMIAITAALRPYAESDRERRVTLTYWRGDGVKLDQMTASSRNLGAWRQWTPNEATHLSIHAAAQPVSEQPDKPEVPEQVYLDAARVQQVAWRPDEDPEYQRRIAEQMAADPPFRVAVESAYRAGYGQGRISTRRGLR